MFLLILTIIYSFKHVESLNPLAASLLGANAHSPTPKSIAFLHDVGGFRWIRNDVPWSQVEQVKGNYTFDSMDSYFHAIRDHKMGLISILSTSNKYYQNGQLCSTNDCIEANKNYAVALAEHFQDVNVWW